METPNHLIQKDSILESSSRSKGLVFHLFVVTDICICCYLAFEGSFRTLRSPCLSSSFLVLPLDVTTPRDSYAYIHRELRASLILGECLVMQGLEPQNLYLMEQRCTVYHCKNS